MVATMAVMVMMAAVHLFGSPSVLLPLVTQRRARGTGVTGVARDTTPCTSSPNPLPPLHDPHAGGRRRSGEGGNAGRGGCDGGGGGRKAFTYSS